MRSSPSAVAAARRRIGPYDLGEVLGGGGMGVVYRGTSPDGRAVAVKTLRAHLTRAQDVQRFEREASIRIDHPNVIEVLDSGVDHDGTPYIVFELLEGESLEQRLDRGPMSAEEAVPLVVEACRALGAVHAAGVVHRDLKPANLFCLEDGSLKLLDFGIARVGDAKMTAEGTVVGTLSYLSPEQARGSSEVDPRTDVWALGALTFELLTGTAPFDRPSPVATLLAILNEEPPRIDERSGATGGLSAVVDRCLRKDPDERWPDVEALIGALTSLTELGSATITDARSLAARPRPDDSVAETLAASGGRPSIRPDEQRIVAVLLLRDVADMGAVESAITDRGGRFFALLGRDAIGLFGAQRWEGDETHRAIRAGLECRLVAGAAAVGSGRIRSSGVGLAGEALRQAEIACEHEMIGVAVPASVARAVVDTFNVREGEAGLSEIVGERPFSASIAPAHEVGLVGRDVEMAQVRAMAGIALRGSRAALVVIAGPPGIGKSRLRREIMSQLAAEGALGSLIAQPESGQEAVAFATWASALRRRADEGARDEGWPRLDPSAPVSERAMAVRMLARDVLEAKQAQRCAEFLGELLGIELPGGVEVEAARRDPQLMADRMRLSLLDYLDGVLAKGPTAIVLEDLEWADTPSLELLLELMDRRKDAPLFVLGTARDDVNLPSDVERRALLRLRLEGLDAAAAAAMAEAVAGRSLDPGVREALAARTEGNPLFVEQVVLDLRDAGLLDTDASELPVPLSVEAAVQSRLDRLREEDRRLCKLLSLFDRPARADELRALGVPDASTRLPDLVSRELLEAKHGSGDPAYGFRSALMGEVAYRTIVPELRKELHGKLGRALIDLGGVDPEEIARHLHRGGSPAEAAMQYARAVAAASRRGDSESVMRCSGAAIELGIVDDAARYELHMARADALRFRGDREAQERELEAAREASVGEAQRARVLVEQGVALSRRGRLEQAEERVQLALGPAEKSGDREVEALAWVRLGEIRTHRGELGRAEEALSAAAEIVEGSSPHLRAMVAERQALLAAARGDIGASWEGFSDAAELWREAGDERREAATLGNLADAYNRIGAYDEAIAALQRALAACRRVGHRVFEGYVQLNLAYARTASGDEFGALDSLDAADGIAAVTSTSFMARVAAIYRARCLVALGRLPEAERAAAGLLPDGGDATSWAAAERSLCGRIRLAQGDVDGALEHTGAALALRDALGGIEEDEADVFLARVEALEAAGRMDEADEVRRRGRERLEEVASRIADGAWRERFLRGPAAHRALFGEADAPIDPTS